jgi:hypothetical protein
MFIAKTAQATMPRTGSEYQARETLMASPSRESSSRWRRAEQLPCHVLGKIVHKRNQLGNRKQCI